MPRKWFIALPLIVIELALCAAVLAATWAGVGWVREHGLRLSAFAFDRVSAEADEARTLAVSGPAALTLDSTAGFVIVTGGSGHDVVIQMHKTAWGEDAAGAQAALADLKVDITQTGDAITIKVTQPAQVAVVGDKRSGTVD